MFRNVYWMGSAALVLVIVLAGIGGVALAQQDDPLPPHVIDVWPLPGVEMAADEPLTITFDQPMDRPLVEAAIAFDPALSGAFRWDDDRTVNFVPDGAWPRATLYRVTVDAAAASMIGLPLEEPYTFDAQTVGALVVTGVTPEDGAEGVAADARIVVTFNRPVVPLVSTAELAALPSPLTIEPAVEGHGEWLNTSIYEFTPSEALKGGTTYTVTASAGLTTVTGAVLDEAVHWTFRTLPPQILNISPRPGEQQVRLERSVQIVFSQPMDHASTEMAFSLLHNGAPVSGVFSWNGDSTVLQFSTQERLQIASNYVINMDASARSASGEAMLDSGQSVTFATVPYPGIDRTNPNNGEQDVRPGRGASIQFRSPMNTDTFADKVIIMPETEWTPSVWNDQALGIDFAALPNTTYTITFLAGAQDVYGNPITTDYTFRYHTGDISTWIYPITSNSNISIVGAHRQDTRMPVFLSGTPTVAFELYRIEDSFLEDVTRGAYYYDQLPPWANDDSLLRRWTETFDSQGQEGVAKDVLLASEQGGVLPEGAYWVVMSAPARDLYQFPLVVASANLTVKRAPDELLVWVTDMESGNPVVETTVTVYHNHQAIARGQTDADGVFRAPVSLFSNDEFVTIQAEGAGASGLWFSYSASSLPASQGYLYTDRPIYRPGETVYFRGVLRDRQDMAYSVPNQRSVRVVATDSYTGQTLFEKDVEVTAFGTFSGEFLLAEDAPVGPAYISAGSASVQFTVAEFRVPEFEVSVTPQEDVIFQGRDDLSALVEASYYFGGPVSGANLSWTAWGEPTSFQYTGPGRYTFTDETLDYFYHYLGEEYDITTDGSGHYVISSSNTTPPSPLPMRITVEATATDESQQAISGRTSVLAHPANVYVGLRSDRYFGRADQPMSIDLVAVTADSEPLADKQVDLAVVEIRWNRVEIEGDFGRYNWQREEIEVETAQVQTDADGQATYTFTPPNPGIFRVRARALDEYERPNTSTLRFWVTGNYPVWWGEPSRNIDLIADKDGYQPGDLAQILVPLPFAGESTVLVSIERAGIMSYDVLTVEGSTLLYELPITEDHVPTVHVDVTVVKGVDEESLNPDYRTGQIALDVQPVEQELTITITPSAVLNQPRDTVSFDVLATDAHGEPVQAEFGMVLTDKAILALMPPNSGTLLDSFYGQQGNYVWTDYSLNALLDRLTDEYVGTESQRNMAEDEAFMADGAMAPMAEAAAMAPGEGGVGGGADTGLGEPVVREDFQQTPLWEAHVVTGVDGRATVSVTLPDNLTTWTLDARALTVDTRVGQTTTEVVATLPLLIRPVTPRFFVVDDHVQLAAVVNNNTDAAQTVEVSLQADGLTLDGTAAQNVTIEAGARARVNWWVTAEDVQYADLTFVARGQNGYQDAAKPMLATGPDGTIPVYRYTAPDTVGTGGVLLEGGSRTEAISLPPRLDSDQGELTIHLDPSLAVTATDTFDYLRNYPHQCIEQTVSRFLPNVVTYRALRDLGLQDPELEANLYTVLNEGLDKLIAAQNPDGGWGWFGHMESNPLVTAYASLGLIEAKQAGFDVDQTMIDRALNFVRTDFVRPRLDTPPWRLNRQAFYFYVLGRGGQGELADFLALYDQRLEMSYMGRAYLLMAFQERYPEQGAINDLVSDLTTAAILSATGAHWEEATNDWWNWASNTRTTAVALTALTRTVPDNALLPNVVRWLMVAREGDHWETTQENVWAVLGLTDWMVYTGELRGQYDYTLAVNRDALASASVTPDSVRDGQVIQVAVRDLLLDEVNRVVVARGEGDGALYYTAHLNLRLPAAETPAISRGVTVTREYFMADDPEQTRITSASVGDVITVRLTLTLPQDIYYFVLEDPLPAGTEGVDTSLLTTSQQIGGPDLQRQWDDFYYEPFWYWGWWWFDHTEMRDEQVNLYADYLPRGTYVYTYQVRASIAGEFQTMPSHAYAFYFPEVFGRGEGTLFTVLPEAE